MTVAGPAKRKTAEASPKRPLPSFAYVQSLERGLAVLRSFDHDHPQQTVADVARRTGLDRAAARRFLLTLEALGYIEHDDRFYRLTAQTIQLGYSFLASLPWWRIAQKIGERLTARIGVSSAVGILDQHNITYVAYASAGRFPLLLNRTVGTQLPAAATAIGRVLLAALTPEQLRDWLVRATLEKYTSHTLTTRAALDKALREAREAGFCIVDQELAAGLRSIGVPIRNRIGEVVAGLSVSVVEGQLTRDDMIKRYLAPLRDASTEITQSLPS
jgi:IclR family transcriptional regulator, pca regulon regulatory protein